MLARFSKLLRTGSSARRYLSTNIEPNEIRIPVSHGYIAAKVWGDPREARDPNSRILAVHGWQDNANSFDKLVVHPRGLQNQILANDDQKMCVVALDFTGHGFSSRLPPGSLYTHHRYVMDIAVVANELDWPKFSMLAHSMGGGIAFYFALLNPTRISRMALVDGSFPFWYPENSYEEVIENAYSQMAKFTGEVENSARPPKEYTMDEYTQAMRAYAKKYLPNTPEGSASLENMKLLLQRGARPTSPGKFVLVRDSSVRYFFTELSGSERLGTFLRRFDGTGLRILALCAEYGTSRMWKDTYAILKEELPKHSISFETVLVDKASHHVHMNEPERILPKLIDFYTAP